MTITHKIPITTILFDFFGTLVAYEPGTYFKKRRMKTYDFLKKNGLTISYDDWSNLYNKIYVDETRKAQISRNEFNMYTVMNRVLNHNLFMVVDKDFIKRVTKVYLEEWSEDVNGLTDIHPFLTAMSQKYTLGIISNTQHPSLISYNLKRLNMAKYFKVIMTSVEHGKRKPDPSIFKATLKKIKTTTNNCIFVGDNYEEDYMGAKGINMKAYLIDPLKEYPMLKKNQLTTLYELSQRIYI